MVDKLEGNIGNLVEKMHDIHNSESSSFMDLFKVSGLSNQAFRNEVFENLNFCDQDLSKLDFTGTHFIDCQFSDKTKFPPNFDMSIIQNNGNMLIKSDANGVELKPKTPSNYPNNTL